MPDYILKVFRFILKQILDDSDVLKFSVSRVKPEQKHSPQMAKYLRTIYNVITLISFVSGHCWHFSFLSLC